MINKDLLNDFEAQFEAHVKAEAIKIKEFEKGNYNVLQHKYYESRKSVKEKKNDLIGELIINHGFDIDNLKEADYGMVQVLLFITDSRATKIENKVYDENWRKLFAAAYQPGVNL